MPPTAAGPLLSVRDLHVSFDTPEGTVHAVRGVSFAVDRAKTLAIVGESGSGKSVTAHTILGLSPGARVSGGIAFDGRDLLHQSGRQLRAIRGAQIGMVFQNPHSSLHPNLRVGVQIAEVLRIHTGASRSAARARAIELLTRVGIANAANRVDDYPHEFSGGMLQRVMIAMAIALNPRLVIADEPTTALDVRVQAQILALLQDLQREYGTSYVLITHDLGVVAQMADDVTVMYSGRAMECAERTTLFSRAHHPYTRGLLRSMPSLDRAADRLVPIRGQPPSPLAPPPGCPFNTRCEYAEPRCTEDQPLYVIDEDERHRSACWLSGAR